MFFCRRCLHRGSDLLSGCRRCLLFLCAAQGHYYGRQQQQTEYHSMKLLHFWPPPLRGPSKVFPKYWHSSTFPIWHKGVIRWESWVNHKSPSVPDGPFLSCLVSFFMAYRVNARNHITSLILKNSKMEPTDPVLKLTCQNFHSENWQTQQRSCLSITKLSPFQ